MRGVRRRVERYRRCARLRGAAVLIFTPSACGERPPLRCSGGAALIESCKCAKRVDSREPETRRRSNARTRASSWMDGARDRASFERGRAMRWCVNDRVDVADAARCRLRGRARPGRHTAAHRARLLGAEVPIGLSTHSMAQVALAQDGFVDYIGSTVPRHADQGYACGSASTRLGSRNMPALPVFDRRHRERAGELSARPRRRFVSDLRATDPGHAARAAQLLG